MAFAPSPLPPRESAVDACARALRGAILSGELAPGSRLPPERELAERFGVTRVTLRPALATLTAAGLVTVRQGSGYRVQDFRRRGGPDLLPGLGEIARARGRLPEMVRELLAVRRHLARAVLERLAEAARERGGRRVVAAVELAVERFAAVAVAGADPERVAEADMDVLAAVLDATGSEVMRLCLNPVLAVVQALPQLRAAMYAEPESNVAGYRVLVAWLAAGAPPDGLAAIAAELERRDDKTVARVAREEKRRTS